MPEEMGGFAIPLEEWSICTGQRHCGAVLGVGGDWCHRQGRLEL